MVFLRCHPISLLLADAAPPVEAHTLVHALHVSSSPSHFIIRVFICLLLLVLRLRHRRIPCSDLLVDLTTSSCLVHYSRLSFSLLTLQSVNLFRGQLLHRARVIENISRGLVLLPFVAARRHRHIHACQIFFLPQLHLFLDLQLAVRGYSNGQ